MTNNSQLIVATRAMPAHDLQGFITWLKANPEKVLAGTAGVGSPQHVFGILFQNATGTRFQFVHYSVAPQAMQDLVAGWIDVMITDQVTALPEVRAGNIKAYAFTGPSSPRNSTERADDRRGGVAQLSHFGMGCDFGLRRIHRNLSSPS